MNFGQLLFIISMFPVQSSIKIVYVYIFYSSKAFRYLSFFHIKADTLVSLFSLTLINDTKSEEEQHSFHKMHLCLQVKFKAKTGADVSERRLKARSKTEIRQQGYNKIKFFPISRQNFLHIITLPNYVIILFRMTKLCKSVSSVCEILKIPSIQRKVIILGKMLRYVILFWVTVIFFW